MNILCVCAPHKYDEFMMDNSAFYLRLFARVCSCDCAPHSVILRHGKIEAKKGFEIVKYDDDRKK